MLNGSMIVERITNSNGTAIKFEDGTMIQTGKKAWTGKRTFSWKGYYLTDAVNVPFAVPFSSIYSCTCNAYANSNTAMIIITNYAPELDKISNVYAGSDLSTNSAYHEINYIAVGTWK